MKWTPVPAILALLVTLSALTPPAQARVDCRKMPFHPYCRGIVAKRAYQERPIYPTRSVGLDWSGYRLVGDRSNEAVLLNQPLDDLQDDVVVAVGDEVVQVPAYIYNAIKRTLQDNQ